MALTKLLKIHHIVSFRIYTLFFIHLCLLLIKLNFPQMVIFKAMNIKFQFKILIFKYK